MNLSSHVSVLLHLFTLLLLVASGNVVGKSLGNSEQLVFQANDANQVSVEGGAAAVLQLQHVFFHDAPNVPAAPASPSPLQPPKTGRPSSLVTFARHDVHGKTATREQFTGQLKQSQDGQELKQYAVRVALQGPSPNPVPRKHHSRPFSADRSPTAADDDQFAYPDPRDKSTVLALAAMSSDTYHLPNASAWISVDGYKTDISFGFESDGLRGYVFSASGNQDVVVIAIKGTSAAFLGIGGESSTANDKLNVFNASPLCCCAAVDSTWTTVCPCAKNAREMQCDQRCLAQHLAYPESYFQIALKIYEQVRFLYPQATVWLTGHSLGGALAALTALETGSAAITFEAPGDLLYAQRLGYNIHPTTNEQLPIWQFGTSADPIFMGQCQGKLSSCYLAGYAMETSCHLGNACLLDRDLRLDIRAHRIGDVMARIQAVPDLERVECLNQAVNCTDCSLWKFQ